jgi:hypothetical protein
MRMPKSSGACVRMAIWIDRPGSMSPARTARATKEPWSMRPSLSNQVSWCASNWTRASGPCLATCALRSGQVT